MISLCCGTVSRPCAVELGLGLFFECGNLLLLIFREVHLLDGERRDQMEPSTETSGTARSHSARRTTGTTTAWAIWSTGTILTRRTTGTTIVWATGGTILRTCTHGNGGNRDDAQKQKER